MAKRKWQKDKVYYAIRMNLSGLHDRIYKLKYDDELEEWCDIRGDFWWGPKQRNGYGHKVFTFDTEKEAKTAHKVVEAYRKHIIETL